MDIYVHILRKMNFKVSDIAYFYVCNGDRNYKTVMNLLRTIGPMKFRVRPKNSKDGDGFTLSPIKIIDKNTCEINFMFEVLFFLPIQLIKKIFIGTVRKS